MRRWLSRLLHRWGDWLEPPSTPTAFEDDMAMLAIDQRQAMRKAFLGAMKKAIAERRAEG